MMQWQAHQSMNIAQSNDAVNDAENSGKWADTSTCGHTHAAAYKCKALAVQKLAEQAS